LLIAIALVAICRGGVADQTTPAPNDGKTVHVAVAESGQVKFTPGPDEKSVPERFRLPANAFPYTTEFERHSGPVRITHVRFPSPVETEIPENNTVHAKYFQPPGEGPFPGCVVLHILGGDFPLAEFVANSLARQGVAALFLKMPYYGERRSPQSRRRMISRDPHETAEGMTQAVLDIRRGASWLAARPEVAADRLGVTGISLGGIMSALSAAGEPRFKKVAVYLGGGELAPSIWENPHPDAEKFRQQWIAGGGTRESFVETLAPVDPATYGQLLKDRDVLMVAARHDEIITERATLALWKSMGEKPKLVWLDAGHITAAVYLLPEVVRLGRFFTDWTAP
jgi:hypothetical protein